MGYELKKPPDLDFYPLWPRPLYLPLPDPPPIVIQYINKG